MSAGLLHFNPLLNHARMCEIWSNRPWTHTRDPVTLAGKFAQSFPGTQWSLVNASLTWNCLKGVYLKRNFKWVRGGGGASLHCPFSNTLTLLPFPSSETKCVFSRVLDGDGLTPLIDCLDTSCLTSNSSLNWFNSRKDWERMHFH